MMRRLNENAVWRSLLAAGLVVSAIGCGSDEDSGFFGGNAPSDRGADDSDSPSNPGAGAEPPAEREVESDYEAPVATGKFVWVANPKSGRVAYVDAATLEVHTVEAGNAPTYLSAVPGQAEDSTLVLNVLSSDATLLRASAGGITSKTFRVAAKADSLAFSSDGRFAIAWADARKTPSAPKTEGFQDLTVMDLVSGVSTVLAVGYRPVAVGFAAGQGRAYAITQDGIAILELGGAPALVKNVAIADDPNEDPGTRDVAVTPDGSLALIRRDGEATITVVALADDTRTTVTLPGPVTDLDLDPQGTRAVATIRNTSQAVILPVPGIATDPATFTTVDIPGEVVGSVALTPAGDKALLYTNAVAAERLTVLDLLTAPVTFRTIRLYSPVLAVFPAPDARHAVVLHDRTTGGASPAPGAFSVVPIASSLPAKIVSTLAPPVAVATTADRAVVAERSDAAGVFGAYIARMPQLMVERLPLASPPTAVGIVPAAKRAFISQVHPEGRLTFVDLDTGASRTLTGFELSSRVVDGSKP